jgi:hypothetical protein
MMLPFAESNRVGPELEPRYEGQTFGHSVRLGVETDLAFVLKLQLCRFGTLSEESIGLSFLS